MLRRCLLLVLPALALRAQAANQYSSEIRFMYSTIKTNLLKLADKMPADKYSYRPAPEVETFARRIAHIAEANMNVCSTLNGQRKQLGAARMTSKEDLVVALKESFAACDQTFAALTDASAAEPSSSRLGGPFPPEPARSRLATLYNMIRHSNEMYGYMAVYLRLNGIVPPTSAPE